MSKKTILFLLTLIPMVVGAATPALAQDISAGHQGALVTGYGTGHNIQVSGWETDLVRKNKGLEKFHWAAMNSVLHYRTAPAGSSAKDDWQSARQSLYIKPLVVSRWSGTRAASPTAKAGALAGDRPTRDRTGQLNVPAESSYVNLGHRSTSNSNNRAARYTTPTSDDRHVAGRVLQY